MAMITTISLYGITPRTNYITVTLNRLLNSMIKELKLNEEYSKKDVVNFYHINEIWISTNDSIFCGNVCNHLNGIWAQEDINDSLRDYVTNVMIPSASRVGRDSLR